MRLFCLLPILLILSSCGSKDRRHGRAPDEIIRLSDAEARGLDPQIVSDLASVRIAADQFEGLTRFDAGGNAIPGLSSGWTVSADGRIWSFELRPDIQFSDGTAIAANVFVKALARIRNEATGSPHKALFEVIDVIEARGDRQVIIRLRNPFPQLPALLAHPALAALPFHIMDANPGDWTAARPLVTSGAYRLTEWRLNQYIMLSANPLWSGGKPATPRIRWQPMDNKQSGMRLMLSGGADTSSDFPDSRFTWLRSKYPQLLRSSPFLATYYFAFNTRLAPFDDVRVRRALSMAVDRQWMTDNMIAAGNQPAWGLLPSGLAGEGTYEPVWANWGTARRNGEARRLLASAGYGARKPLSFEIRFNSSTEHRRAAVALATMWRSIGVQATLLNSEASLHFDSLKRGDFALARSGWVADLPAAENFLAVHRSAAGPQNYSGYANPAFDAALDKAMAEPDTSERAAKMRIAEAILANDTPILPLYFYVTKAMVQPEIIGWQDNNANVHPSYTLARKVR